MFDFLSFVLQLIGQIVLLAAACVPAAIAWVKDGDILTERVRPHVEAIVWQIRRRTTAMRRVAEVRSAWLALLIGFATALTSTVGAVLLLATVAQAALHTATTNPALLAWAYMCVFWIPAAILIARAALFSCKMVGAGICGRF